MRFPSLALILGCALAMNAWAIPTLQLDINNGSYVGGSEESTITTATQFTLQALLTDSPSDFSQEYYISVALTPQTGPEPNLLLGSFLLDGTTVNVTGDMVYGAPPLDDMMGSTTIPDMPSHGIFQTFYYEFAFTFDPNQTTPTYNVEDGSTQSGNSYLREFVFDIRGLSPEVELHFDLYAYEMNKNGKKVLLDFAPFSHDAGTSDGLVPGPGPTVPDGGTTLGLLGLALLGMGGVRRLTRSKNRTA